MLTLDQPKSWAEIYGSVKQNKNKVKLLVNTFKCIVIYTYILSHIPTRLGLVIPDQLPCSTVMICDIQFNLHIVRLHLSLF